MGKNVTNKMSAPQTQEIYHVLARRTRPQSFQELVGQETVAHSLSSMISSKRTPHAFLFTGTRGTGKTSSARILAKSLCCEKGPTIQPCQVCSHCLQITACSHPDVLEIDGASNNGVDNVRELRDSAQLYPSSARYRIFIIDEVHMLTVSAFNALLKTLEEPPPQVIFILATTELNKVPNTVRSRCMIFSFQKVDDETLCKHLRRILDTESLRCDEDSLALIAREAKGSVRDALSLLEQVVSACGQTGITSDKAKEILNVTSHETALAIFRAICQRTAASALQALRDADHNSVDLVHLIEEIAKLAKHALVIKEIKDSEQSRRLTQLLLAEFDEVVTSSQAVSTAALSEIFRTLMLASREIGRSTSPLPWAEVAILDCICRSEWLSATELLSVLSSPNTQPVVPSRVPESGDSAVQQFARVVDVVQKKNALLGARLRSIRVVKFSSDTIEFGADPFTGELSSSEAALLREALDVCGFGKVSIKGLRLVEKQSPKVEPAPGFLGKFRPAVSVQPSAQPPGSIQSPLPADLEKKNC